MPDFWSLIFLFIITRYAIHYRTSLAWAVNNLNIPLSMHTQVMLDILACVVAFSPRCLAELKSLVLGPAHTPTNTSSESDPGTNPTTNQDTNPEPTPESPPCPKCIEQATQLSTLKAELAVKSNNEAYNQDLWNTHNSILSSLETELSSSKNSLSKSEYFLEIAEKRVHTLTGETHALRFALDMFLDNTTTPPQKYLLLCNEVSRLHTQYSTLRQNLYSAWEENTSLKRTIEGLQGQNRGLEARFACMKGAKDVFEKRKGKGEKRSGDKNTQEEEQVSSAMGEKTKSD
ncbi:hypothetical protein GGR57DRAFT_516346 [Xylariaceae sp. FL1272]|nr:hypothetical protein GGR57DRAFT_516346 [Xylariaceae sp. FL1272]